MILTVDASSNTLFHFRSQSSFRASHGLPGGPHYSTGRSGSDLLVSVPAGTHIYDNTSEAFLGSLMQVGDRLVVANGGEGGQGSSVIGKGREGAGRGVSKWLRLELKLVADIALVGVPNAG